MEEKIVNENLVIHGDLLCGPDGILEAADNIAWAFSLASDEEKEKERFNKMDGCHVQGDLNLTGKKYVVNGSCYVFGQIYYDNRYWTGHVTAGSAWEKKNKNE